MQKEKIYSKEKMNKEPITILNIIMSIIMIALFIGIGFYIKNIENNIPTNCYDDFRNDTLLEMQNYDINPDVGTPQQCQEYWNCKAGYCKLSKEGEKCYDDNVTDHQKNFMMYCDDFGPSYFLLFGKLLFMFAFPFMILTIMFGAYVESKITKYLKRFKRTPTTQQIEGKNKRKRLFAWSAVIFLSGIVFMMLAFILMLLYSVVMNWQDIISDWHGVVEVICMLGICILFLVLMGMMIPDYYTETKR